MAEKAIRITLSTKKVVVMRLPLIKHQEQAMRLVGKRAADNTELHKFLTGVELIKLLVATIDEKPTDGAANFNLDDSFSPTEMKQLGKAIEEYMGADDDFLPQVEAISIGA